MAIHVALVGLSFATLQRANPILKSFGPDQRAAASLEAARTSAAGATAATGQ